VFVWDDAFPPDAEVEPEVWVDALLEPPDPDVAVDEVLVEFVAVDEEPPDDPEPAVLVPEVEVCV
jgi:hypothetical protein